MASGILSIFKSKTDESGGCLFEMSGVLHVGYFAQVMDDVLKSVSVIFVSVLMLIDLNFLITADIFFVNKTSLRTAVIANPVQKSMYL